MRTYLNVYFRMNRLRERADDFRVLSALLVDRRALLGSFTLVTFKRCCRGRGSQKVAVYNCPTLDFFDKIVKVQCISCCKIFWYLLVRRLKIRSSSSIQGNFIIIG